MIGSLIAAGTAATVLMGSVMYGVHTLRTAGGDERELQLQQEAKDIVTERLKRSEKRADELQKKLDAIPPPPPPTKELKICPADCLLPSPSHSA